MMKKYVVKIVVLVAVIVFAACSTLTPREREPISFSGKLDLVHTQ